jgi:hypothetical protein
MLISIRQSIMLFSFMNWQVLCPQWTITSKSFEITLTTIEDMFWKSSSVALLVLMAETLI